ncbi:unnamed protein product [Ostreobium quekettii]|uniref:Uncharacterized protein n=1 Tax=Ostreobium quekettii TaxID=121088 RepID=A0A8S1J0Q7_9CHLO|nr:unnamed protein product [Ostreobium quekettii]
MTTTLKAAVSGVTALQRASPVLRPPGHSRAVVVARAQKEDVSRREAVIGVAAASGLLIASPALAFEFGEGAAKIYERETSTVIEAVEKVLTVEDAAEKEAAIADVRLKTNSWVAKYRRDQQFAGRPSYSNMYSALNALAGHYNSFGPDAPIPKKRLERVTKVSC